MNRVLAGVYLLGAVGTFVYLVFFDGTAYNWWNWFFVIPIDLMLAVIWPVHWLILRPLMG